MDFKGVLRKSKIILDVNLADKFVTQLVLVPSNEDWKIGRFKVDTPSKMPIFLNDGWDISTPKNINRKLINW